MRRAADTLTRDLFELPRPAQPISGSHDFRPVIAGLVSECLDHAAKAGRDRYAVAAEMSRLAGKTVSKAMLDAYSSSARDAHNMPFYLAPALEAACECHFVTLWLANTRGAVMLIGREAYDAEMGRLERIRNEAAQRIKDIKKRLGEPTDG